METNFVNKKFCDQKGVPVNSSLENFALLNKKYYADEEEYDWVEVVDNFRGLEAILHLLREKTTASLVKKYGKGEKYLDAGCGTGLILRHLPEGSVGLDINPRNLKKAKNHALRAKLIKGDVEKMPFRDETFNTIVCTEVLEHLLKPEKAIKEFFRVLSEDGVIIGSVPARNPIWKLRFLSSTHPGEPYHKLYERSEVKSLFKGKGKIIKIQRGCLGMSWFFVVSNDIK